MLATRVIPTMLVRDGMLVKGKSFNGWRTVGNPMQATQIHQARSVDELIYLDIGATAQDRPPDVAMVARLTAQFFAPITVGGGVKTVRHVRDLLAAGADKVAICSAALDDPKLIEECCQHFGSQAIVGAVEYRGRTEETVPTVTAKNSTWRAHVSPVFWAKLLASIGVGEILLQNVERDGTMAGYDLDMVCEVAEAVDVPVIASGGCSSYENMHQAILAGANAVAAGALFQFTDATPRGAALHLQEYGIEARV